MRPICIILVALWASWSRAEVDPILAPTPPRAPGEAGTLGIAPWGLYIDLLHNDSFSHTDKLLTQSSRIGLLGRASIAESYNVDLAWRIMNPSFKPRFGADPNDEVIGCFADWLELSYGHAHAASAGNALLKAQWHLGVSHFGGKGGRELQIQVHRLLRTTTDHLTFRGQREGFYGAGGLELGFLSPAFEGHFYGGAGARISEVMTELFARALFKRDFGGSTYRVVLETKTAYQLRSRFLGAVKALRYEVSFGVSLFDVYRPTVTYVSGYLQGDDVGQIYIDFLNFAVPI